VKRVVLWAALLVLAAGAWFAYQRLWRLPSPEELEALRREHQRLSDQVRARLALEAEPPDAAEASVVVGVPVAFAERFGRQVSARLLEQMTLRLQGIEVEKEGDLHARLLVGRTLIGHYVAHVSVDEVRAVLRAGKPQLRVMSPRLAVTLPVDVLQGSGKGRIRFRWDSRGAASGICGDFEMTGDIGGTVVPAAYTLRAQLTLTTEGPALVAIPELDDLVLPLRLEPSAETWKLLDTAIEQRGALCRTAVATADVPQKIRELIDRGFDVKLPRRLLPAVHFPVEMEKAVDVEGGRLHFQVKPVGLTVARSTVWYRTDVRLLESETAPVATESETAVSAAGTETSTETPTPTLEGKTNDQTQGLVVAPAPEEHLEVRPQPQGD